MCYVLLIKITLNTIVHVDACSAILTCMYMYPIVIEMFEHMWSRCKHHFVCPYDPLAPFVAITNNTNWQKGGGVVGGKQV